MDLNSKWEKVVSVLDYAFQPIVNIHTGSVFGFEALLREWGSAGFGSIKNVFDRAYEEQCLYSFDLRLREKALEKFLKTGFQSNAKLFYNLDNRLLLMPDYSPGNTARIMDEKKLPYSSLCFEISERYEIVCYERSSEMLNAYKQQYFRIAVDDFGSGYSGLQLLYHSEPDMVKLDRFFIDGIERDAKKKLFVTNIVNMAHIMGIIVIAEGVETDKELYVCREIGCDFVQGYLIQRPVTDIVKLQERYTEIETLVQKDKRYRETSQDIIYRKMECFEAVRYDRPIVEVLEKFRADLQVSLFPVVNENDEPLGILREKDLKFFVYSPFGVFLLKNPAYTKNLMSFITKVPTAEIHTRVEKILEIYAIDKEAEAVIITENGKYKGMLSSRSLLQVLNEKEIADARDQNPLSRLPGNNLISEYISESLAEKRGETFFAYLDFDNFKPFNDTYGFRQGDRVILLFSDLLREACRNHGWFIGHIGGDDFFAGISGTENGKEKFVTAIRNLINRFAEDVKAFYGREDRQKGYIIAKARDGKRKKFEMLSISASIIGLGAGSTSTGIDKLSEIIAELKPQAKKSPDKISYVYLNERVAISQ
jgi:diguanylate cyclase (GGDEF)-like protein